MRRERERENVGAGVTGDMGGGKMWRKDGSRAGEYSAEHVRLNIGNVGNSR